MSRTKDPRLLWQSSANLVATNRRHLFAHSSGSQKSETKVLTRLPCFWELHGGILSLLLPPSSGCWYFLSFSGCKTSSCPVCLPFSQKDSSHWIPPPPRKSRNLSSFQNPRLHDTHVDPFPKEGHIHRSPGAWQGDLLEAPFSAHHSP